MTKSARFSIIVGGVGLLILLLVGIVAGSVLLRTSQDIQNQASVKDGVVSLSLRLPSNNPVYVNQPLVFNLLANTSNAAIDAIQLKGTISGPPVTNLSFTPASDLKDLNASLVKVEGNRIELIYTLKNTEQPFIAASPTSLGWLTLVPQGTGTVKIEWDNANSKATLYKRAVDSLKAVETINIPILEQYDSVVVPPTPSPNVAQATCQASGGVWRQFGNSCIDSCGVADRVDVMCAQVMTYGCDCGANACWNGSSCTPNHGDPRPSVTPSPSIKPTPDPYRCVPRPQCLDAFLPCRMAEPATGWCPRPTTRPTPTPTITSRPTPTPTITSRPTPTPTITTAGCVRAGCSGQLCVPASQGGMMTTCEFRPEYACYQQATCALQANGQCGFTQTPELQTCLAAGDGRVSPPVSPSPSPSATVVASPSPTPSLVPNNFDLNGDGRVNLADLTLLIQYLRDTDPKGDMNHDNRVNIIDYSLFIQMLGGRN